MKPTHTAIALALAVSAAPAVAQYQRPVPTPPRIPNNVPSQATSSGPEQAPTPNDGKPHPSAKALKALVELKKAVDANDTAGIPAKIAAAEAVASTKDDRYLIAQMRLTAAVAANDDASAAVAIDAIAGSGFVAPADVAGLYTALGGKMYKANQFDGAARAFERAIALNPSDAQSMLNLAEARVKQGRSNDAVAIFQRVIQLRTAASQKPEEALYRRAFVVASEGQMPAAMEIGKQWITAYPSQQSWRNGIAAYQNFAKPDLEAVLDALRLMRATNALGRSEDYTLYATAAAEQSNYNEAQVVIDEGLANKLVDPSNSTVRDIVAGLKAKSKATEADLIQAEKDAKDGKAFVRIGDRYYAMGKYAKAAELYRQSIGKAGVDANVANMHLGMALAQSGDKAGATAAFNAVTGSLSEVAKYWLIYVQQRA
jgi:tetratricopeptide (TPR) repeat protein